MSYQITEEEKNKVKLNSPFALPNSPTERGMKPDAIKAMFWKPFEILIELINTRFGKMTDSEGVQRLISELQSSINEALNNKQNQLVIGENLDKIPTEYSDNLVTSGGTYSALLELRNIIRDINVPNIYYVGTFDEAIRAVNTGINIKPNDIIIITTTGEPDLVVFHMGSQAADGALLITQAQIEAGAVPTPKAGDRFTIENAGLGVICLECGIVEPKITVEKELCDSENPIAAFAVNENIQTIVERVDTAESIAKGANQAVSFGSYEEMVSAILNKPAYEYNVGQNIMILDLGVPDLWVSGALDVYSDFEYISDGAIVESLFDPNVQSIRVGYYYLSALETQKVDLTLYAEKKELATKVDKLTGTVYGNGSVLVQQSDGSVKGVGLAKPGFESDGNVAIYHNSNLSTTMPSTVLRTGTPQHPAHAANKQYVDDLVGDISTALTELHDYAEALKGGEA